MWIENHESKAQKWKLQAVWCSECWCRKDLNSLVWIFLFLTDEVSVSALLSRRLVPCINDLWFLSLPFKTLPTQPPTLTNEWQDFDCLVSVCWIAPPSLNLLCCTFIRPRIFHSYNIQNINSRVFVSVVSCMYLSRWLSLVDERL